MRDNAQASISRTSPIGSRFTWVVLGLALFSCLAASSAQASTSVYEQSEMILPKNFFGPAGLAVDQETGDVYAAGFFFGSGHIHRFAAGTEKEDVFGEGDYQSVAIDPTTHNIYALTREPTPLRVEIYNQELETARKPIPTAAGQGIIGADSRGNVFVPDIGPINEQQRYTASGTGGTYELVFNGEKTAPIAWNAGEGEVAEALENLSSVGAGDISVTRSGQTYIVTFGGSLQYSNVPEITADSSGLTGGTVTHIETINDGTNAPPSVKEYAPTGILLQTITCSACPGGALTTAPIGVALDANDNLFVGDATGERVIEFHATPASPATDYTSIAPTELASGNMRSFTVNPATDDVWVLGDDGEGTHVKGFEVDGTEFTEVGKTVFTAPFFTFWHTQKMAVNGATGTVYVGDLIFTAVGKNGSGEPLEEAHAAIVGFSPAPPPIIEADPAIVEASRHATMKTIVNPNGTLVLSCTFEYGLTEAYGTKVPCNDPGFGKEPVSVGAEAVGLAPDTTYHYRVTATNEGGTTVGPDQTFKTLIDKAVPATGGASALQTTATLEGTVNPLGNPMTACYFEYGSGPGYGAQAPCASLPGASASPVPVSGPVGGLTPNSSYHYRLVAVNAGGTEYGGDRQFATLPKAPVMTTGAATLVGADRARISGTVNPEGSLVRYQFDYGPTTAYGKATPSATAVGSEVIKVAENITGLQPATTYHYRFSATSVGGTTHGPDLTFTTGPRPIGRVFLPAKAPLKRRNASIEVQCRGVAIAECKGTLVLRARIKRGIRFILVKVGETPFDFFGGQKRVLVVHLNKAGRKVIAQSEGKPISAVASAANKNRVIRLSHGRH
jgi:hypothetical protein